MNTEKRRGIVPFRQLKRGKIIRTVAAAALVSASLTNGVSRKAEAMELSQNPERYGTNTEKAEEYKMPEGPTGPSENIIFEQQIILQAGQELVVGFADAISKQKLIEEKKKEDYSSRAVVSAQTIDSAHALEDNSIWDRLANCESSGNWTINTGNGYFGGLQMDMSFWTNYGGLEYASSANLASREQQITVAIRGQVAQGWGAWPTCSSNIGLR